MMEHVDIVSSQDERLARLDAHLEELHLEGHWRLPLASRREPKPFASPYLWHWNDVRSALVEAGEIHALEADAGRRTIRLCSPGLAGNKTTPTLQTSIQLVKPGEVAPAHRHTMNALRYVIEGTGGYTTVNGAKLMMEPGDLVLTPGWSWHDHGHDGDVPMIWIDGHDFPFTHFINGFFSQGYTQPQQVVTSIGSPDEHYVFKSSDSRAQLDALGDDGIDTCWGRTYTFADPRTGDSTLPTMKCRLSRLCAGEETLSSRRTASVVYHVVEGNGVTLAGTEELHWSTGDFFAVPAWTWQQHRVPGSSDAVLFSISDEPILEKFGVLRVETAANS
jgi:gentisate 1,2-dioxygenase